MAYNSDYEIRLAQLEAMGGDVTGKTYNSVYDIDLEILRLTEEGGGSAYVEEVTYSELKSLRDNSQLVAGQQYRITDYVTTTAQSGTTSAGHPFDIIVTADDVNKLNENARAINHTNIISAALVFDMSDEPYLYMRYPDGDADDKYAWCWVDGNQSIDGNDFSDIYTDDLIYTNDEVPSVGDTYEFYDDGEICTITDVQENINTDYFANSKLESWELKYCLDNDTKRFSWAQEGNAGLGFAAIKVKSEDDADNYIYKRYPNGDYTDEEVHYGWVYVNSSDNKDINEISDWDDIDSGDIIYTTSQSPSISSTASNYAETNVYEVIDYSPNVGEVQDGKGVIYYMKDEWNNQVYFDFKNIKIYVESAEDYLLMFEDSDEDTSLDGTSNNNIVCGLVNFNDEYDCQTLTLDTSVISESGILGSVTCFQGQLIYGVGDDARTLNDFLEWVYSQLQG